MTEVVSVKFRSRGKTYFFEPNGISVPDGCQIVVETSKGLELADCVKGNHYVVDERIVPPLRPVIRLATADDLRIAELCKAREAEAFKICEEKIAQHRLDMKLVDVECNFEGNKILFFFTSDGRVDFRELVKDLAGVFRTRIELRQIGVRDEAKMLGGLGICGRPFCCSQFLDDFQPVSTKMAKTQSLSLNPAKISGTCGRLMCCLRYEQEAYEELVKNVPKNGAFVETPVGYGNVAQVNLLRQKVKVKLDGGDESLKSFDADEVAAVPGGRPKPGEPLPHVLTVKPKPAAEEKEEQQQQWVMPQLFGEEMHEEAAKPQAEESREQPKEEKSSSNRRRNRHRKKSGSKNGETPVAPAGETNGKKAAPAAAEAPAGEKSGESGEKKSSSNRRRSRHRKSSAPGQQPAAGHSPAKAPEQSGKAKPASDKNRPQPQPKATQAEQRPGGNVPSGEKNGSGEAKKRSNYRRRHHRPRSGGNNGGSAAKSE